eukprot:gene5042-2357_t
MPPESDGEQNGTKQNYNPDNSIGTGTGTSDGTQAVKQKGTECIAVNNLSANAGDA